MTDEQVVAFLMAAKDHARDHYPYFCTLALGGLGPGEGFALIPEKINLRGHSIVVDCQNRPARRG